MDSVSDIVSSDHDALASIIMEISLDIYITYKNISFGPQPKQIGGTCYAHASATVLHLAMLRIFHREGGHPDFDKLRDKLIDRFGVEGANVERLLREVCPEYRLHYEKVNTEQAMSAITSGRPILATFHLTGGEWESFSQFYETTPKGILTRKEIDIRKRPRCSSTEGHAVVLTTYNSKSGQLRLMNSWGMEWGDSGFFNVESADVLGLEFFDIFWTLNDLTQGEKDSFRNFGYRIVSAGKFIWKFIMTFSSRRSSNARY